MALIIAVMGFIRIILIFALLYLVVRLLSRVLFPPRKSNFHDRDMRDRGSKKKEGDVTVEDKQPRNKKIDKDDGDYIDYEEVK